MEDPQMPGSVSGSVPPPPYEAGAAYTPNGYAHVNNPYPPPSAYPPPHPGAPVALAGEGLTDNVAGALAYVTILPAILFLVLTPYNTRPFVKFHAIQCLGIALTGMVLGVIAAIPFLGWIVGLLGMVALMVVWVLSVVKAFQGSFFRIPKISEFAAQQSGYTPGLH